MGDKLTQAVAAGTVKESKVDDSVMRILTPMFQFGVFDTPNNGSLTDNVTSAEHNIAARAIAAASTVLLKNDGDVLPLPASTNSIAIIGSEASAPTTHGHGSGQVRASVRPSVRAFVRAEDGASLPTHTRRRSSG